MQRGMNLQSVQIGFDYHFPQKTVKLKTWIRQNLYILFKWNWQTAKILFI